MDRDILYHVFSFQLWSFISIKADQGSLHYSSSKIIAHTEALATN